MQKILWLMLGTAMLAACSDHYKISVRPPDCSAEPNQAECQEHQYAPTPPEIDRQPEWKQRD